MNHLMITISRQYGSNGREIGRRLAEYLDIGYYNKEIMKKIATDIKIDPSFFEEENRDDRGLFTLPRSRGSFGTMAQLSVNAKVFDMAQDLIQGIAQRESAVIVGRCADYILRDDPSLISIFCYSDFEDRVRFSIQEYGVPEKKARQIVSEKDNQRSNFYELYTNQRWGEARNYDLMINTSRVSVEEAIELISALYDQKQGVKQFKGAFPDQYLQK